MSDRDLMLEILRSIRASVSRLEQRAEQNQQSTNERLDHTNERLDQTNARLDKLVIRVERGFDDVRGSFAEFGMQLLSLTRVAKLDAKVG